MYSKSLPKVTERHTKKKTFVRDKIFFATNVKNEILSKTTLHTCLFRVFHCRGATNISTLNIQKHYTRVEGCVSGWWVTHEG